MRNKRRFVGFFEYIVPLLYVLPKGDTRGLFKQLHVGRIHSERKDMQVNTFLPRFKRFVDHCINFIDFRVCHGVAANRSTVPMYHDGVAGVTF